MLYYFRYNPATASRGVRDIHFSIRVLNYGWGDGGEGAFKGGDEICWGGGVAECVCGVWDGEVVHFVVHDYAGFGDH